jgi:hypothetical protein
VFGAVLFTLEVTSALYVCLFHWIYLSVCVV